MEGLTMTRKQRKTEMLSFRVTEAEAEMLRNLAEQNDVSLTEYLRLRLLPQRVVTGWGE
jgi:hypothetical protein